MSRASLFRIKSFERCPQNRQKTNHKDLWRQNQALINLNSGKRTKLNERELDMKSGVSEPGYLKCYLLFASLNRESNFQKLLHKSRFFEERTFFAKITFFFIDTLGILRLKYENRDKTSFESWTHPYRLKMSP